MKKFLPFLVVLFTFSASGQTINFSDANLQNYLAGADESNGRAFISGLPVVIDTDSDGQIQVSEALLIEYLHIEDDQIGDLNGVQNFTNLLRLEVVQNPLIGTIPVTGLDSLLHVDLSGCTGLSEFIYSAHDLIELNLSGCTSLTTVVVGDNQLTSLDLSGCVALQYLSCENNQLTALDLSNLPEFQLFNASDNPLASIDFTGDDKLSTVELRNSQLTSLDLSGSTFWLYSVDVTGSDLLTDVDLSDCPGLEYFDPSENLISLNLANSPVHMLNLLSQTIETLNVQGCDSLEFLHVGWGFALPDNPPITSLDVSSLPSLTTLDCWCPHLTNLDLENSTNLEGISMVYVPMTSFDFSPYTNLTSVSVDYSEFTSLDVSGLHQLTTLGAAHMPALTQIFAKNGADENMYLESNSFLTYICQDEAAVASTQTAIDTAGLTALVTCNSYCSFTPGTDSNIITGTVRFDSDANGCDASDETQSAIRIDMTGDESYSTFTSNIGQYILYAGTGNFEVVPNLENPGLYIVEPETASVQFSDTNNNISTHDFCVSANGIQNDAEITIAPIGQARPGFGSGYMVTIRNKGNQTLSGTMSLTYEDDKMDYLSASLPPASQTTGVLNWTYTNLLPFEHRSFYLTMQINAPTDSVPVNNGDILLFSCVIDPIAGDMTPADNEFSLSQTVVGSYDPNDITCLEGPIVSPSAIGKYLHYIVNFENIGTAEAENVVVRVDIDPTKFDMASLQLMSTSHAASARITGNRAEFIFQHINLGAAAGNPPVGGHGNVLFKIKTLPTLLEEDVVQKSADIYFDYNFPIVTNDAETVFRTLSSGDFKTDESVSVYPNPAKNTVTVKSQNPIESVQLFDVQGRLLETVLDQSSETKLDISQRASGVYFIRINTVFGSAVKKLFKQ